VTELVVEFSSSAYLTDTQLSRLKQIPENRGFFSRSWGDHLRSLCDPCRRSRMASFVV